MITHAIESDRDAFLRAIVDNPDDDTPRLVFADWLMEHGETEEAERIWYGVKNPKEIVVSKWALGEWVLGEPILRYNRGLAVSASALCTVWIKKGPQIIAEHPLISRVDLRDKEPWPGLSTMWSWFGFGIDPVRRWYLPDHIFKRLRKTEKYTLAAKIYETRGEALDALSDACIDYAKTKHRR